MKTLNIARTALVASLLIVGISGATASAEKMMPAFRTASAMNLKLQNALGGNLDDANALNESNVRRAAAAGVQNVP